MAKTEAGFDIIDFYAVDPKREKDGAKLLLSEDPTGKAFFIVRPYPNDDQQRAMAKVYMENHTNIETLKAGTDEDKLKAEALDRSLTAQVNATHVLVGCGGMSEPYSVEYGTKCLMNSRIRDKVFSFAVNLKNFKASEEDVKKK